VPFYLDAKGKNQHGVVFRDMQKAFIVRASDNLLIVFKLFQELRGRRGANVPTEHVYEKKKVGSHVWILKIAMAELAQVHVQYLFCMRRTQINVAEILEHAMCVYFTHSHCRRRSLESAHNQK
jgi:hypothetical protein